MSVRGKLDEFFRVKILGMRFRIASAHVPYTCRDYLRIVAAYLLFTGKAVCRDLNSG
jgi:hypothetical protein